MASQPSQDDMHSLPQTQARTRVSSSRDDASEVPLPTPAELERLAPLSAAAELRQREFAGRLRARLRDGRGPLIAIVGPCSIHSEEAALAYAERLAPVAERLADDVLIVMRAYFEKPRTTVGWKGFLSDPDLDGSDDLGAGLSRGHALLGALSERGLPLAAEILDPLAASYFEKRLSWAAIGARTAESQIHRQLASRLACPVGIKNGTDGSLDVALCAMQAARAAHSQLGIDAHGRVTVQRSEGNPRTHLVLRGGKTGPNYDRESVGAVAAELRARGEEARVLIDCSHGNSGKDPSRQPAVARAVLEQLGRPDVDILGIMVESHLVAGRQEARPGARPDVSVTDACIGFEDTESLLEEMALAQRRRRG